MLCVLFPRARFGHSHELHALEIAGAPIVFRCGNFQTSWLLARITRLVRETLLLSEIKYNTLLSLK
jgi:hypothetical protein